MMPRMQTLWTCSVLIVILFTESHCIQKTTLTKNWGPQSMLYLKGKYGRRYVPDSGVDFYKSALKSWYAVIRDEVSANWKIDSSFHGRESADPLHRHELVVTSNCQTLRLKTDSTRAEACVRSDQSDFTLQAFIYIFLVQNWLHPQPFNSSLNFRNLSFITVLDSAVESRHSDLS
ncbi:hypothetical protein Q7C36_013126 [Tachysurus vachellii]|uniref:Uncharacterized protein n=1 Tax=Tachysurus vachellii TaxID=175792 RepID=A0AA88MKN7_TACVA|nr:hypothetical protein Q7C36_013126 [Tachysurus vachellii]